MSLVAQMKVAAEADNARRTHARKAEACATLKQLTAKVCARAPLRFCVPYLRTTVLSPHHAGNGAVAQYH